MAGAAEPEAASVEAGAGAETGSSETYKILVQESQRTMALAFFTSLALAGGSDI